MVQTFFSQGRVDSTDVEKMCKLKDELFKLQHTLSGHTKKEVLRDESLTRPYTINPDTRYILSFPFSRLTH